MTKLFNPEVLGDGITIEKAPSQPKHAVRKVDLEGFVKAQKFIHTNTLIVTIPKATADFMVQCYDENKQLIIPDSITETDDAIEVSFFKAQTGVIRVLFIGGSSGN